MDWAEVFSEGIPRECGTFEAKKARFKLPDSVWETVSAFSNTFGGTIVLGVTESDGDLQVTGVEDHEKMIHDIWSVLNDRSKISRNSILESNVYVRFVNGKAIVIMEVPREKRENRPVYLNNNPMEHTYRRSHEGDYRCTEVEVREMMRDSGESTSDGMVLEAFEPACLNPKTVEAYMMMLRSRKQNHRWLNQPLEEFLRLIGALAYGSDGALHPTGAGLLMFGEATDICNVFPHYFLDYRETDSDELRWTYRLCSATGEWSGNLFDFYTEVVNRLYLRIGAPFKLEGFVRIDDSDVLRSIREALMNAMVHADYYGYQGVIVRSMPWTVEIRNPGLFRIPMDRAMGGGESDPRNPRVMNMMMIVGLVESIGSGIRVMSDARRAGNISLSIRESVDPSAVTVRIGFGSDNTVERGEIEIMEIMDENPLVTLREIAERTGVSQRTVSRSVESMKIRGLIGRAGSRRSGRWVVLRRPTGR